MAVLRDAERAAALLVQASLAGLSTLASDFHRRLEQVIRQDGNFATAAAALGHLLYLYRYDEVLGTSGRDPIGTRSRRSPIQVRRVNVGGQPPPKAVKLIRADIVQLAAGHKLGQHLAVVQHGLAEAVFVAQRVEGVRVRCGRYTCVADPLRRLRPLR